MPRDLNDQAVRHDDGCPTAPGRPRRRLSIRLAAVAGLSVVAIMGAAATALANPAPTQPPGTSTCLRDLVARVTLEADRLPVTERNAYFRAQLAAGQARCLAAASSTPTTTTTTTTTTSPTTTTTTSSSTTSTTTTTTTTPPPPSTTTRTTSSTRYEVVVTGGLGVGAQTLVANCRATDRLVSSSYVVPRPTGSGSSSRSVSVSSNNRGISLTYQVTGTVSDPRVSLTAVCQTGP